MLHWPELALPACETIANAPPSAMMALNVRMMILVPPGQVL
jgi:hypothetical protein